MANRREKHVATAALASERYLVGALLLDPALIPSIRRRVDAALFTSARMREFYSRIVSSYEDCGEADPHLLAHETQTDAAIILALMNEVSSTAAVHSHCGALERAAAYRAQLATGRALSATENYDPAALETARASIDHLMNGGGAPLAELETTDMSTLTARAVEWLWPGRIALGKMTVIAGDPGLGKSFLTLDLAARVTTGSPWPDWDRSQPPPAQTRPARVVLFSAEDDLEDTILPRLQEAGGDPARVVPVGLAYEIGDDGQRRKRWFNVVEDLSKLDRMLEKLPDCRLVVFDPLSAYLAGVDTHKDAATRGALAPLAALAMRRRVAVVYVTHLRKADSGPAIYRAMGSIAFVAAARAAWGVIRDKEDPTGKRRLFLPVKNNLGEDRYGLAYTLQPTHAESLTARIVWDPTPVDQPMDEALAEDDGQGTVADAVEWLDSLIDKPVPAAEVYRQAKAESISTRTLERAKRQMGIESRRFEGRWMWYPRPAGMPASQPDMPASQPPKDDPLDVF